MNVFKITSASTTTKYQMQCSIEKNFKNFFETIETKMYQYLDNNNIVNILSVLLINIVLLLMAMYKNKIILLFKKLFNKKENELDLLSTNVHEQPQNQVKIELDNILKNSKFYL